MATTAKEVTVCMPLFLHLSDRPKAKKYIINLNYYKTWHYLAMNNVKKKYKEIATPLLEGVRFNKKVELTFTLWMGTRRRVDRANPLCIHEKFFCDVLTESGCIPDDNDDYIEATHYYTGGVDKENPRVEIRIAEVA